MTENILKTIQSGAQALSLLSKVRCVESYSFSSGEKAKNLYSWPTEFEKDNIVSSVLEQNGKTLGNYCRVKSYPVSYTQYKNYLPVYAPEIISIRVSRCLLDVYKLLFKINTITKITAVWDSMKYPMRTYPKSMSDMDGLKEFAGYRDAMLVFDFGNEKYSTKLPAFAYRALLVASEVFKTFSISYDDRSHFIGNVTDKAGRSKRYLVHYSNKGYLFEAINETSDSVDKLVGCDKWVEVLKKDGWKFYNDK
ncbi:TPA: hypothetical protein RQK43_000893 [Vibrio vulnificus]|uniref:hypothetical protein n=1 Tax=Vibrio vulnificus TaxID=672 RepID=UPI0019D46096|nr:hypothetical protein [Vibrio vulnificus]MBN8143293.1 hypothetical protein [Vibrio vulnificus]MCA0768489.1 hypothetical protein [Vibrio vulnificus]HAS6160020.1 hypothetical protein [Vibrio vulnificus]HAS6241180.1 hypothetical protein [Vibrio vulnificus]HDY7861199.1 hypothetical protein [Vibrio vulnificus]